MKQAVILLNMGGPSSIFEVDMFLKNMFNDPHILPIKSPFFRALVANFITYQRGDSARANYQRIGGKSPLVKHTFNLIQALQSRDSSHFYTYAMRYTPPMTDVVVQELAQKGIEEVVLFSLYPHYSSTTTLSSLGEFYKQCEAIKYTPKIHEIDRYYSNEKYNKAIVQKIIETLDGADPGEFTLIFSAHAIPQKVADAGDPYEQEIHENIAILKRLLAEERIAFKGIDYAFQSKIGPVRWLEPSLEKVLLKYKNEKVIIYPIAFTIDNSETDFELRIDYCERAQRWGIAEYRVAPCLNDSPLFVEAILHLISKGDSHDS